MTTTKQSERNAFDVALQYATGIKIGAGWREIALGIVGDARNYEPSADFDDCPAVMDRVADGECHIYGASDDLVEIEGSFEEEYGSTDAVVIFESGTIVRCKFAEFGDGPRWECSKVAVADGDKVDAREEGDGEDRRIDMVVRTESRLALVTDWAVWQRAKKLDARLHSKPSWRERAAEAPPLVDDDSDISDAEVTE